MSHESYELKAEARERVGKGSARELRRNGLIPAVIYGDKQAPISIALNTNEVTKRIHAGGFMTTIATIEVDGKKYKVLPKDYQLDPVRDFTMHVDFLRVSGNTQVTVEIPVHFINEARNRGKLLHDIFQNSAIGYMDAPFTTDRCQETILSSINLALKNFHLDGNNNLPRIC